MIRSRLDAQSMTEITDADMKCGKDLDESHG